MRNIFMASVVLVAVVAAILFFMSDTGPAPVPYAPQAPELLPPEAMGTLAPETTAQGTLPDLGTHLWTFDAAAGDVITVRLMAMGGTLAILPPDDIFSLVQVSVDPAADSAEICDQPLAETGTYTLQIQADPASIDPSGPYVIRIERLGPATDTPLPSVTETVTTDGGTMTVVRSPPCQTP